MENKETILNELREISPLLAGLQKVNVYTVPDGYFTNLAATLYSISANPIPEFGKKETYQAPQGYFENLPLAVLEKIKAQENNELIETAPMLASIGNKNVYAVPAGYFESLSAEIIQKVNASSQTKVVSMKRSSWLKYAIAAVFVGVVSFGVIQFAGNKQVASGGFTAQQYENAIKTDVEKGLDELSDESIINFLDESGDADAAVVASFVNEEELPDALDYMLDDNTLEDFLNNKDSEKN